MERDFDDMPTGFISYNNEKNVLPENSSAIFELNMNVPANPKSPERVSEQNQNQHNILTTSELKDCRMCPKTPERKNQVELEKLPFVITSSGCKQILEENQKVKEEKENAKENRKHYCQ